MSTNERNEHFQGFAKLLMQELNKNDLLDLNVDSIFDAIAQRKTRLLIQILASRAYDLVYASCEAIDDKQSDYEARITFEAMIDNAPDLTQWPTTEPAPGSPTSVPPAQSGEQLRPPLTDTP